MYKKYEPKTKQIKEKPEHWKPGRVLKPGEFIAYDREGRKIIQKGG